MDVAAQIVKALESAGYGQIEAVARTRSGHVLRAVAPTDGRAARSVILKIYSDESEGPDHEAAVLRRLGRAFQLLSFDGKRCLEMPDIGGVSVASVCARRRLAIDEALAIGAAVAGELTEVHRRHVIHKDVNPSNVVWNERTGAVQLIDFGVASELPLEQAELAQPSEIEGTLAYMAPEQTGRMNRPLDARADLYALGVTLYEMLTGRRPFERSDPLELVYCHLACAPVAPREVDPAIPEVVSDLVLRLMAKEPQDRYQTGWGVEADLRRCVDSRRSARRIEPFPLGRRDIPDRLAIPRRLYGRDDEIEAVALALERATAEGRAEVLLVGGPPGIGKSALAHELLRPITGKRGMFGAGKCDRSQRATPYDVLAKALQGVVRHLLGAEPDAVAAWRQELLSALGENGALVTALVLGRRLIAMTPAERLDERLFVILDQLKAGEALLADEEERLEVAGLFLRGGQRALGAASFEVAASLLGAGVRVLGEEGFARARELAVSLYRATALAACLIGDFGGVERLVSALSSHAASVLEEVEVDGLRIRSAQAQDRSREALRLGLRALGRLGLTFPEKPAVEDVLRAISAIRERLAGEGVEELAKLPPMRDPCALAAMQLIRQVVGLAFQVAPAHYPLLVTEGVRLSIEHGNAPSSPQSYVFFGNLLVVLEGDAEGGARFGRLAMEVMARLRARELSAMIVNLFECMIHPRTAHFRDTLAPLRLGHQEGLSHGDFEWASHCGMGYCIHGYLSGAPLRGLLQEIEELRRSFAPLHQERTARYLRVLQQATLNLLGAGGQPTVLKGEAFDAEAARPGLEAAGDSFSLFYIAFHRTYLLSLFGDFRGVLEEIAWIEPHLAAVPGLVLFTRMQVPEALACLMVAAEEAGERRGALVARADGILAGLRQAARHAPMNFGHLVALIEAVRSGIQGEHPWATARLYDEAVTGAEAHGFVQDAAFACELAGRVWLAAGRDFLARAYLERARRLYARWGAVAKVAQLEQQHATLLPMHTPMGALITTSQAPAVLLDAASLFKASRAIASSLALHELPTRFLAVAMENAGAQRGALFVEREGALVLEAAGDPSRGAVRAGGAPVELAGDRACLSVVRTVARTRAPVVLEDARTSPATRDDPYVASRQSRSVLCAPVLSGSALRGVLYLENDLVTGAFTAERVEVVAILSAQAAVALENAFLYGDLERLLDERTRLLEERTRLLAQAEEGVRARDTFLTLAAHELRTPLTPLQMEVQTLLRDARAGRMRAEGSDRAARKLERAGRQIGRLERLANDLLDVARLAAGEPEMRMEPVDLSLLVRDVAARHAAALKHAGSALSLDAEPGVVGLWDRVCLVQVADKLLSNAVKFGEGKPIDVRVEGDDGRARLVVRDRGAGIARATQARLFGRFERGVSERHFGGLGLGLWIARRIVDALGGSIRIDSEPGAGATFIVELPREPPREARGQVPSAPPGGQASSSAHHGRAEERTG
ncbi:hypothetical protein BE20_35930 [Sorangium cellulosum]|nr:hypothetical protein BE20_35930 [Sorangium cellulosum]